MIVILGRIMDLKCGNEKIIFLNIFPLKIESNFYEDIFFRWEEEEEDLK